MVRHPGEKKRRGIFRRLMARPFLVLGGIAAGIACLLLAVSAFRPYLKTPMSWLSDLKTGPKVFRTKIPEEIKLAQNLFHGKIPAVDQPVNPQTNIERMPPVQKKAVPSQQIDAAPEENEPRWETEPLEPLESQKKIEQIPAPVKAAPSQRTDAVPEKSKPQQETARVQPVETPTKIENIPPAEEQSVSPQPIVAPSEKRKLPEKVDTRQAELRPQPPVKEDTIEKSEERIIHREKWLLSQESSYYTIQLMGVRKEALLFDFVERNQLLQQNQIAFYQTTFKDKPWFQLLYGVYATKKDAQSAADNLPPKIRRSSPWIRRLSGIQKAIRNKAVQ